MEPTPKQASVIALARDSAKPIAWFGAVRAGKSVGAVLALLSVMRQRPGDYIVMGFSWGNLDRNIMPFIRKALDDDGDEYIERKAHPKRIETEYGRIHFMIASHTGAEKVLQGMTINGAFTDEILLYPRNVVMQLVGRFSHERPFWIMTANKSDPAHWIKTEWADEGRLEIVDGFTDDNPHISEDAKSWHKTLITGAYADRMLNNEWKGDFNMVAQPELLKAIDKADNRLDRFLFSAWIDHARHHAAAMLRRKPNGMVIVDMVKAPYSGPDIRRKIDDDPRIAVVANVGPAGETAMPLPRCGWFNVDPDRLADFASSRAADTLRYQYFLKDHWKEWGAWAYRAVGPDGNTRAGEAPPALLAVAHGFMRLSQAPAFAIKER